MYLYIDESIFSKEGNDVHGVGLLATETEIDEDLINEALFNLERDPDIEDDDTKPMDMDTLKRRYFHAADDSKNGHSHLCRAISEQVAGEFRFQYTKPSSQGNDKTTESIHRLNTQLVALITTHYNEPITIFIEQRSSLSQENAEKLIEDLFDQIDLSAYAQPALSAIYPKVTVKIVSKENPGIQVVDFILWAVNNKSSDNKKGKWVNYLDLMFSSSFDQPQGDMAGGDYLLNQGIKRRSLSTDVYPCSVFPLQDSYYEEVDFETIYLFAEQKLHSLARTGLPEHAKHFESELRILSARLNTTAVAQDKLIRQVAKLFIRLFDTLPMYQDLDPAIHVDKFEFLLHVRRCMGLVLCGEICGCPAVEVFRDLRSQLISENRDIFNEEPKIPL